MLLIVPLGCKSKLSVNSNNNSAITQPTGDSPKDSFENKKNNKEETISGSLYLSRSEMTVAGTIGISYKLDNSVADDVDVTFQSDTGEISDYSFEATTKTMSAKFRSDIVGEHTISVFVNDVKQEEVNVQVSTILSAWKNSLPLEFSGGEQPEFVSDSLLPQVAVNNQGYAVVVWKQYNRLPRYAVFMSEYIDGSWHHPENLSDHISIKSYSHAVDPKVDISNNGDAVIAWSQYDEIYFSERRSGQWNHPEELDENITMPTGSRAIDVQVVINDSGDTVIVWRQYGSVSEFHIAKSEYSNGVWTHPSTEADFISVSGEDAANPQVAMDNSGNVIISWLQHRSNLWQVFMSERRSGTWTHPSSLTDHISVAGKAVGKQYMAMDNLGNAIITWEQSNSSNVLQAFKSEYRFNGSQFVWDHPDDLNDNITPDGSSASIADLDMDNLGNAIIVWRQSDGADMQLFLSEYRSGVWSHPTDSANDYFTISGSLASSAKVSMSDNGNAVLAWQQRDGSNQYQVFKSEYKSGSWIHPSSLSDAISLSGYNSFLTSADMNSSGGALIAWYMDTASDGLIMVADNFSGNWQYPSSSSEHISADERIAIAPSVAMNDSGEVVVAWSQFDGSHYQIFKSEFREGSWIHPSTIADSISFAGENTARPNVSINNSGETIIVWGQSNGSFNQVFISEYRNASWTHPLSLNDHISTDGGHASIQHSGIKPILNDDGDAVIAWTQNNGAGEYHVYLSENSDGVWTHPANLSTYISPAGTSASGAVDVSYSMVENGGVILAWTSNNGSKSQVYMSERRSGVWDHPDDLNDSISIATADAYDVEAMIDKNGDIVLAYTQYDGALFRNYISEYRNNAWNHPANFNNDSISLAGLNSSFKAAYDGQGNISIMQVSSGKVYLSEYRDGAWTHASSMDDAISPSGVTVNTSKMTVELNGLGETAILLVAEDGNTYGGVYSDGKWFSDRLMLVPNLASNSFAELSIASNQDSFVAVGTSPNTNQTEVGLSVIKFEK